MSLSTLFRTLLVSAALALPAVAAARPVLPKPAMPAPAASAATTSLLDDIEHRTFDFFWKTANPKNGLVPDHWPLAHEPFSSIAATGFGLTAYGIGAERGWITRPQAVERTLATLRFFDKAPQNDSEDAAAGYHGFFYHFLDLESGRRYGRWVELSSIDTTLLLGGVLFAESYYDRDTAQEKEIRDRAEHIYARVDWTWMQPHAPLVSMGWTPGGKFIESDWRGYNEANLLYILALGSPTHAVEPAAWTAWTRTNDETWGTFQGQTFLNFAPLFGHQYTASWIDLSGIRDAYMRRHDLDYFENARRATYAQRAYATENPGGWRGYGENVWGLTACNGPGDIKTTLGGLERRFYGYSARGAGLDYVRDDGTIAPTAAISSIVFAPEIVLPAIRALKDRYGKHIYSTYGFRDAFNPSFRVGAAKPRTGEVIPDFGWVDDEYLGIDQGPIILMIENYRSGLVWKVMKKNPHVRRGLERAGFTGGWLDALTNTPAHN